MDKLKLETVDIMLDLETMGLCDNTIITQISAVAFNLETETTVDNATVVNKGTTLDTFNVYINARSCVNKGLKIDGSSVEWWLKQPKDIFDKVFLRSFSNNTRDEVVDLPEALQQFTDWVNKLKKDHCIVYGNHNEGNVAVWGNGILADNKWLRQAYKSCSMEEPWHYTQDRDVRTIVDMGKRLIKNYDPKKIVFVGEKHNAVDDCLHQIKYVCDVFEQIRSVNS
jgi:hypothetical protein